MNSNNGVFLRKVTEKIKKGDYDKYFTIPFMSQDLLISSVKTKLFKKLAKGNTPVLMDSEIMLCVQEVKETAASIFSIYLQTGIIEKTEEGYELSKIGKIAIKQSSISFLLA
jgi:hypothetical protein